MSASPGDDNTEDVLGRMARCGAPFTAVLTVILLSKLVLPRPKHSV